MFGFFKKKEKITSELIKNIHYEKEYEWYEGKADIESFDQTFDVIFSTDVQYAEKCIESLNNKKIYDDVCKKLVNLCNETVKDYLDDEELAALYKLSTDQIMEHVQELQLLVLESKDDSIGYCICGNCDWNEEEGFILVIRDNKIVYAGEHGDDYSPWENFD